MTNTNLQNDQSVRIKAKLFRGFADPSRLLIIEALRNGRKSVGQLVELTGLSQPNVSNHLRCLADCDLIRNERNGRYNYYMLSDDRINTILSCGEQLLAEVAKGVIACTRYEPTDKHTQISEV